MQPESRRSPEFHNDGDRNYHTQAPVDRVNDAQMLAAMKEWGGGKPETVCGSGSTKAATENVRKVLPQWMLRHRIFSIADVGAGDQNWIKTVELGCDYQAYDLIPRNDSVRQFDLCKDLLPHPVDAILCRHTMNHLPELRVLASLWLFSRRCKFLIATQHIGPWQAVGTDGHFAHYDLTRAPFCLPDPLEVTEDANGSKLAIWRLS